MFSEELLVCRLYFLEHRRAKEIASLIGKSEPALRAIIFRARQRQRNKKQKQCGNAPFGDFQQDDRF
jgi:DNA-directed RNA polymerase specialized sigma24 family protein